MPRSNGFIESQMKSVDKALLKARITQAGLEMALLCLRATPVDHRPSLPSPVELVLGHPI